MLGTVEAVALPPGLTRVSVVITELRGPMTRQVRDAVMKEGGESAWEALLAKVSGPCRATFTNPIGLYEWIPAEHSKELSLAFMATADPDYTYQRGMESAKENLTVVNRWILRLMSPGFLVQNMPRLFAFYYRGGQVVVDRLESGSARVSLWADAFYPIWYERGLPGWLMGALALAGAKGVSIRYLPPDGEGLLAFRHGYEIRWQA
ncbi:MAG TPA: hypothetical protein VFF76_08725 [Holophagaceae bacterium]|nr:hypothetical protein [Holophagaceae bacterium]